MLLPEKTTLSIRTECTYYTAIYERVYTMTVHASDNMKAVVTVLACSKAPSGFVESESRCTLIESEEVEKPTSGSAKSWLAQIAQTSDNLINERSGSAELIRSARIIRNKLSDIAQSAHIA